jgi:hypothetical protein
MEPETSSIRTTGEQRLSNFLLWQALTARRPKMQSPSTASANGGSALANLVFGGSLSGREALPNATLIVGPAPNARYPSNLDTPVQSDVTQIEHRLRSWP